MDRIRIGYPARYLQFFRIRIGIFSDQDLDQKNPDQFFGTGFFD